MKRLLTRPNLMIRIGRWTISASFMLFIALSFLAFSVALFHGPTGERVPWWYGDTMMWTLGITCLVGLGLGVWGVLKKEKMDEDEE